MPVRSEEQVEVSGGRRARVVLVRPDGAPPAGGWPGVVVLHEVFGLQPEIVEVGERFAERGYAAAVPDYFSTGRTLGCLVRAAREVTSHRPGAVTALLADIARHLAARPDVDGGRLATIGFCMGGGFALLLGGLGVDGIKAVAANYADVPAPDVLRGSPPVVASYGAKDRQYGPKAQVLRERLSACGVEHDVKLYDEAGHSFMTRSEHPLAKVSAVLMHAGYVDSAASDAWERVFSWLDRHV